MHIRRGFLGWGVFLILAGAVPLLVRSGYLDTDQVGRLWQLWPLIIIGIGVGLILRHSRFEFIGGLIVAATIGVMLGGLLSIGFGPVSSGVCGSDSGSVAFPSRDGTFSGAGSVDLELDCGQMNVSVAPGNGWHVDGQGCGWQGARRSSRAMPRSASSRATTTRGAFWAFGPRDTWNVTVPDASKVDFDLQLNAGCDDGRSRRRDGRRVRPPAECRVGHGRPRSGQGDRRARRDVERRVARSDPAEPVAVRDRSRPMPARCSCAHRPEPPSSCIPARASSRSYDFEGHGLVKNGIDLDDPRVRHRGGEDRAGDVRQRRSVQSRPGGRL